eukprot:2172193-Pleurochrysis_carterae.AAC.1
MVGQRIQCNFKPFAASWYGGVVGMAEESCIYVGFDDGELHAFTDEELVGMGETGAFKILDAPGGLIDNEQIQDMAMRITSFKEGKMTSGKPVGVLVGEHQYGSA